MSADDIRTQLRAAEAALNDVRREMDEHIAIHGCMPEHVAKGFALRLEAANSRVWQLRGKLRTPAPR